MNSGKPIEGLAPLISKEDAAVTTKRIKYGKASAPSVIVSEMLNALVDWSSEQIAYLINAIIKKNKALLDKKDIKSACWKEKRMQLTWQLQKLTVKGVSGTQSNIYNEAFLLK